MRIGLAGAHYGHFGMMVVPALEDERVEFVGVAEPDKARRREWAERCGCPGFGSLDELLAGTTPDVVIEGGQVGEKAALIQTCASARVDVMLDKPLGLSIDELRGMARVVAESGIRLTMFFSLRYSNPFYTLQQLASQGALGRIVTVISTHPHKLQRERRPESMFRRERYPGALCDFVCHGMDFTRWLTGAEPVRVVATHGAARFTAEPHFEDHARCMFDLDDGAAALITGDWLWPDDAPSFGEGRVIVTGTEGTATLRAWSGQELETARIGEGLRPVELRPVDIGAFVREALDAWEAGHEAPVSTIDVFQTALACLTARESADRGGEQRFIEDWRGMFDAAGSSLRSE